MRRRFARPIFGAAGKTQATKHIALSPTAAKMKQIFPSTPAPRTATSCSLRKTLEGGKHLPCAGTDEGIRPLYRHRRGHPPPVPAPTRASAPCTGTDTGIRPYRHRRIYLTSKWVSLQASCHTWNAYSQTSNLQVIVTIS